MNHQDHVRLIAPGLIAGSGGVWADLGSGDGAFTLALRDVAGPEVEIWSVDRDRHALLAQQTTFARRFPNTRLHVLHADFTAPLDLPPLDGILSANAIHFVRDQAALLRRWREYLKAGGRLIVVEYDADVGNRWVPHPLSFSAFASLAPAAGFREPTVLATVPSRFLGRIYAAATSPARSAISEP